MRERDAVRAALARLLLRGAFPPADWARFTNALLDECGHEAAPLARRTVALGRAGLAADVLAADPAAWPAAQARLAAAYAAAAASPAEAAWIAEAWAFARGVIPASALAADSAPVAAPPGPPSLPAPRGAAPGARRPAPVLRRGPPLPATALERWAWRAAVALALVTSVSAYAALRSRPIGEPPAASSDTTGAVARRPRPVDPDTLRLPDGRLMVGRILGESAFAAAPRRAPPTAGAPTPELPLVTRGVGGTYRVRRALRAVDGDPSCLALVQAIDWRRVTEETIAHVPGHTRFAFDSRPGVVGDLGWDGSFRTADHVGTTDYGGWRFRMAGRFTGDGFDAESETVTRALIKYRTWQTCRVLAALHGERAP